MGIWVIALTAGGLIACAVVSVIAHAVGEAFVDGAKEAVFRRRAFARRRGRLRGLLYGGAWSGILTLLAGLVWLAAATSGNPDNAEPAKMFFAISAVLGAVNSLLLATWWRMAGGPRHS